MNAPSILKPIATVFLLSLFATQLYALTPEHIFEKVKDSIVVVKTLDAKGKAKVQGSGVLLPSGLIATNCHVVDGGASIQGKLLASATLHAEDSDKDICLLDAKNFTGKPAQLGTAASLKVGASVYAVGAPQGLELSLSSGIVSQLRGDSPPLIQTTAAISPGSSGGGLFDGEGRLVGLTTLYVKDGQGLNFAMPVEWIGEIKPGRKKVAGVEGAAEWMKQVIALKESKDLEGVVGLCQKWTRAQPENDLAWFNLGLAFYNLNRYDESVYAYRQAIHLNPNSVGALCNLGNVFLLSSQHYSEAVDVYRQAVRIKPEDSTIWNSLGVAYLMQKSYGEAIEAHRQALRIDPDYSSCWANLGNVYIDLNRYDEALDAHRQALRIDSENNLAWNGLGFAYRKLNRYNESFDAYRQSLRIDPKDSNALFNIGTIYILRGNNTAALGIVKELRSINPKEAEELFNLITVR
ncbi:MAG: tetratricopeptide repeat protein [Chlorobium sp.]|nr:tetratricopeptide repeat protein [Chlorobium sp.]